MISFMVEVGFTEFCLPRIFALATTNGFNSYVSIFANNGIGRFEGVGGFKAGRFSSALAFANLTLSGQSELLVVNNLSDSFTVFQFNGRLTP